MALHLLVFGFVLLCSTMVQSSSSPQYSTNTTEQRKYVTPNESIPCGTDYQLSPCLTIAEYANWADIYFVNDSTFFFYPGDHVLNIGLTLSHIHNISFKGLPEKSTSITGLSGLDGITWNRCVAVEISNIIFNVESNFTYILSFEFSFLVILSNVTILGNAHSVGCSAVISEKSEIYISNSKFVGIVGDSGAALIGIESIIIFAESNYFFNNTAASVGGAMSLHGSTVLFRGYICFAGNNAGLGISHKLCKQWSLVIPGSGGAIFCDNSTLTTGDHDLNDVTTMLNDLSASELVSGPEVNISSFSKYFAVNHSDFVSADEQRIQSCPSCRYYCLDSIIVFRDNYAILSGGALFVQNSVISLKAEGCSSNNPYRVDVILQSNAAFAFGGAMALNKSSMQLFGNLSFVQNSAHFGGALYIQTSNISFCVNCTTAQVYLIFQSNSEFASEDVQHLRINLLTAILRSSSNFNDSISSNSLGGAILLSESFMQLFGNVSFINNTAEVGGAIFTTTSNITFGINCHAAHVRLLFQNNFAFEYGGALFVLKGSVKFHSCCNNSFRSKLNIIFENNSVNNIGGAISLGDSSSMHICGVVSFVKNTASYGGALTLAFSSSMHLCGVVSLLKNNAINRGGAILLTESSSMHLCGVVSLVNNTADFGGAIHTMSSNISFGMNCNATNFVGATQVTFILNIAKKEGGAIGSHNSLIYFIGDDDCFRSNVSFENNTANNFGGAISLADSSSMHICGVVSLVKNKASQGGAISLADSSSMHLCGVVSLVKNNANFGGAIHTISSSISFGMNCHATNFIGATQVALNFSLNHATSRGGAIGSHSSNLYFMGTVYLSDNTAGYGGAMMLQGTSKMILRPSLTLNFVRNSASQKGGAIYYHYSCQCSVTNSECFISFEETFENISLMFTNNSASEAGSVLYIGTLGSCDVTLGKKCDSNLTRCKVSNDSRSPIDFFSFFQNLSNVTTQDVNRLSSDVNGINFIYSEKNLSISNIYPGKVFNIILVAFGEDNFTVSTRISSEISDSSDNTEKFELKQLRPRPWIYNSFTSVSYRLLATNVSYIETVYFKLYHDNPCGRIVEGLELQLEVKPCPLGFQLSNEDQKCVCDERLKSFINRCYIDNLSMQFNGSTFWISKQFNDSGLMIHRDGCPFDFCKDKLVNVSLSDPDVQCDFNRSGTLCGQCKENYSLSLGTLHCLRCTNNNYIALIIPFAVAGIVLVLVILFLHLTVDVGTLNGLIFYVNIVHSNSHTFLPKESDYFEVFTAWLNLDFGIETCFYNGMDIYTYSWLQFVFPFYIWFLIGAIIFVSRYSKRVSKSIGQNPVAALATLLFVSYGKILNAIITPLSLTHLTLYSSDDFSLESTHSVWLYDGSIGYFKNNKHIVLGLFAISILLIVFLPYTFLLLCGHWLMAYSDKCFLSWLNRIKPFMDVYYAPFKKEGRYWIGLVLLSRLALLLTIAINAVGSDSVNILVIASVTAGLLFIKRRVYENNYIDLLESSFVFNLCVLSIATFYLKEKSSLSQYAVSSVSVAISMLTFSGILLFHLYLKLKSTYFSKVFIMSSVRKCQQLRKKIPNNDSSDVAANNVEFSTVTSSFVELREPLIDEA